MDIFVINLDRDQERWASLQSHAQEQGLTLIRHSAVYGKALTEAELKSYCGLQEAQLIEDLPLTPGEIGCYLSHIAVMKRIVDQDLPYACVLEDDVSFLPSLPNVLKHAGNYNTDFDILRLVASKRKSFGTTVRKIEDARFVHLFKHSALAGGYVITQSAAKRCLDMAFPIKEPFDHPFFRYYQTGLRVLHCLPNPVIQNHDTSNIQSERLVVNRIFNKDHINFLVNYIGISNSFDWGPLQVSKCMEKIVISFVFLGKVHGLEGK